MDLAFLAQQATNILAPALPFIYAGGKAVVDKSKDMLLEKGIEKLGSESWKRAKTLLDKISPKMGESQISIYRMLINSRWETTILFSTSTRLQVTNLSRSSSTLTKSDKKR